MYENPAPKSSVLNAMFAVGAFISPFLLSSILLIGLNWRYILVLIAIVALFVTANFFTADKDTLKFYKMHAKNTVNTASKSQISFLYNKDFYINVLLLFFYLGFEYSINGWFITYLKDTGIMSISLATTMVSVTWIAILISRLFVAKLSQKVSSKKITAFDSFGLVLCFCLLISLFLLGLFMAPVFPLVYAISKSSLQGSAFAMTVFTALTSMGGILTPYVIGVISNNFSINTAILTLIFNAVLIFILSFLSYKKSY